MNCIRIHFWPAYFFGLAYEQQGQIERAVEEFRIAVKMSGDVTFATAGLGHLYGTAGKVTEARAVFDELNARAARAYVPAYDIALVCAGLGWKDQALAYLSQATRSAQGGLRIFGSTRDSTCCAATYGSSIYCVACT